MIPPSTTYPQERLPSYGNYSRPKLASFMYKQNYLHLMGLEMANCFPRLASTGLKMGQSWVPCGAGIVQFALGKTSSFSRFRGTIPLTPFEKGGNTTFPLFQRGWPKTCRRLQVRRGESGDCTAELGKDFVFFRFRCTIPRRGAFST